MVIAFRIGVGFMDALEPQMKADREFKIQPQPQIHADTRRLRNFGVFPCDSVANAFWFFLCSSVYLWLNPP
jgi:hypothetical protein